MTDSKPYVPHADRILLMAYFFQTQEGKVWWMMFGAHPTALRFAGQVLTRSESAEERLIAVRLLRYADYLDSEALSCTA